MEFLGGIIRTALATVAGGLIADGIVTTDQVNMVAGAIVVVATAAWSLYQKRAANKAK